MYRVGQILYTILDSKHAIFPVKVVEEVTVKNLESEKTNYKVLLPNSKEQKVDLDRFDKVFSTMSEASTYLVENAKNAIDDLVKKSTELEEKYFNHSTNIIVKKEENIIENIDACNNDINSVKIDLGGGQSANINLDNINNYLSENIQEEIQKKT
tara:strand:- start:444 stop:908 length:465 start_codon:yes stop_codon:yes gene_type:complete